MSKNENHGKGKSRLQRQVNIVKASQYCKGKSRLQRQVKIEGSGHNNLGGTNARKNNVIGILNSRAHYARANSKGILSHDGRANQV